MKPWIKAGIVGGILQIALTLPIILVYFMPLGAGAILALCVCVLYFLFYPVPGLLAAHWSPPPRTTQGSASAGALAGLLAAGIDGLATVVLLIVIEAAGLNERYVARFIPNTIEVMNQSGMQSLELMITVVASLCSLASNILIGAGAGALGGVLYAAIKRDQAPAP